MAQDESIIAMGEDLGRGGVFGQYQGLHEKFGPERVIDTPISEAGIAGAAVGMALAGLRPVVEMRVIDFALCAIDEIVNQAAKNRYMFGGQGRVPVMFRMPIGLWSGSAAQHSQSLESWFTHIPGLTVITPATAQDNFALFQSALKLPDPVLYLEHKELWSMQEEVDTQKTVAIGKANSPAAAILALIPPGVPKAFPSTSAISAFVKSSLPNNSFINPASSLILAFLSSKERPFEIFSFSNRLLFVSISASLFLFNVSLYLGFIPVAKAKPSSSVPNSSAPVYLFSAASTSLFADS